MRNALFLNSGLGRFMEAAHMAGVASTNWTWSVKFADLDGDGWVDLFVTNGMTRDFRNSDLVQQSEQRTSRRNSHSRHDFWDAQDLLRENNLAFRNTGKLGFDEIGDDWGLNYLGVSFGAAFGDLDNDGDLDLAVNNFQEPVSVYRNLTDDNHFVKIRLVGRDSNSHGVDSAIAIETDSGKQVRYLTHSRGFMSSDEPIAHFGLGKATTINRLSVRWRSGRSQTFDKLPADRLYLVSEPAAGSNVDDEPPQSGEIAKRQFVESASTRNVTHREEPHDDFSSPPLLPNKLSQLGPGLATGDVNGDGQQDLYLSGAAGHAGGLYLGDKGRFHVREADGDLFGSSDPLFERFAATEEMGALLFEADADGDLDLFIVGGGVECEPGAEVLRDRLYLNDGHGQFRQAPDKALPDVLESGSCVNACDFDRDGDLDLFVGGRSVPGQYPLAEPSRLLMNHGAVFEDVTEASAAGLLDAGLVTGALWSDIDDDSWLDLLVTVEWGPIKLYRNEQGRLVDATQEAGLADLLGWWNGIAGRDLDNDGDIDYVVTNFGWNTKYHPTPERPALLYYGDFDGSGKSQLIEAKQTGAGLLPVRGKSCSQDAMPFIREKLPNFHDFAVALLPDIYSDECLSKAIRLEARVLSSAVLRNDGRGRFKFQPLPRLAQIAPSFGVGLTDVDGDGKCDILLAQNFFTPQRETGQMDGGLGLLLRGLGNAEFEPVWPNESGVVIPGDAKSLVVADINDDIWPDFLVGVNNGDVQAFENRGSDNGDVIGVRLLGPAGNPTAIGARFRVLTSDHFVNTA
jgi:hypothetical protein